MITGMGLAVTVLKVATFLGGSFALITGVKVFNTYELKGKKKGGNKHESDEIESLRKAIGSRNQL
ncbi:hypothetical protein [Metabacillus fastidiosus]|uniref:hypothetical protein n=1 Tax=Metabacillus fastidiosus TaxID=1458 RepID=UPI003D287A60